MIKSLIYRATIGLAGHLPVRTLRGLGSAIGTLLWLTRSRMWLVSQENIRLCYPHLDEQQQNLLARESLRETGKTITETTFAWAQPVKTILDLIENVHGKAEVDSAAQAHDGVIFIIPHLGNWEVINHYLGKHYGLTHMYQPNRNSSLDEYIQTRRNRTGTKFVPTNMSGIRAQRKALQSGGCIGVMPDQEPLIHTGTFANFFGIDALTNELSAGLARTGARMFTAVCERTERGFDIQFNAVDARSKPQDVLTGINTSIENAIKRIPAQYLWSYKRFRTRPAGKPDFYPFDQHPARTFVESSLLWVYVQTLRVFPGSLSLLISRALASLPFVARTRRKITRINLQQCKKDQRLVGPSMATLIESALEAPRIWNLRQQDFDNRLQPVEDGIDPCRGSVVLTPPIASREALLRYLGNRYCTTEYYHPNSITSVDKMIRHARHKHGIKLVEHDDEGRAHLTSELQRHQVVTLCPDQQPRLRGGVFVPFFTVPALTTKALPSLLRETEPELLLGIAWRNAGQIQISLASISYVPSDSDEEILTKVNQQLEAAIDRHPVSLVG
jgi:KDO2-lipid IV(A) lauroyltransferase